MKSKTLVSLSVVAVIAMIGGALILASQKPKVSDALSREVPSKIITKTELAHSDGKSGQICFVAVDKIVYQIKDSPLWQNGQHTTSGSLAYCGADMSKVIDKAPHGRRILDQLTIIGRLKD